MKYERTISFLTEQAWAILPEKLHAITALLKLRAAGLTLTPEEIRARIGSPETRDPSTTASAIAILPLQGVLIHRLGSVEEHSGATSTERFAGLVEQAANDPEIGAIVIDTDSPGGGTVGIEELHRIVLTARQRKKIVAIANGLMASAAYYVASAADEIVAIPSGDVGHIGTVGFHIDESQRNEQDGLVVTVFSAGKHKADANPFEPLTEQAREMMQDRVDQAYDMFVRAVAKGRGVSVSDIRNGYGQGKLLTARAALEEGLIDRVETMETLLQRLASKRGRAAARGTDGAAAAEALETYAPRVPKSPDDDQHKPGSIVVQTLIFPKKHWDSLAAVKKWARERGYRTSAVDETEDSWRLRQRNPSEFQEGTFRTYCVNPSHDTSMADCRVKAVGGRLRGKTAGASDPEPQEEEVDGMLALADAEEDLPPWADHEVEDATIATTNFAGSPRSKYGTHASKGFKGGADGYKRAWRLHFSQVGGGKLDAASSGPIRGTVRRVAMIAAGMKPPCKVVESEGIGARQGGKSPLPGDFPSSPKDYGLSSWAKPSDDDLTKDDVKLTCPDLNVIKRAASAEIKWRAEERERKEKKGKPKAEFRQTVGYREHRRRRLERLFGWR